MTYVANALRGVIAVLLVVVIIILLVNKNKEVVVTPSTPASAEQSAVVPAAQALVRNSSTSNFVHPPAEGTFAYDAVRNFTSRYDRVARTITITADVSKSFFFEATAGYKVYNSDGVLILTNGFQPILENGEDYISSPKSHLPAKITFVVPASVRPGEVMVFRFTADNPSGLEQYDAYWGTTIKAQ